MSKDLDFEGSPEIREKNTEIVLRKGGIFGPIHDSAGGNSEIIGE